jgi:hypothetical protein
MDAGRPREAHDLDVALYTALSAANSALGVAALALLIVRSQDLGLGTSGVGLFFAIRALGALIGGVFAGGGVYDGPRAFVIAAIACMAGFVSMIVFGLASTLVVALFALALAGLVAPVEEIAGMTAFQNLLPPGVYGRTLPGIMLSIVFGLWAGSGTGRFSLATPVMPEPEVAGHMLFGAPPPAPELIPEPQAGANLLAPRLYRYL